MASLPLSISGIPFLGNCFFLVEKVRSKALPTIPYTSYRAEAEMAHNAQLSSPSPCTLSLCVPVSSGPSQAAHAPDPIFALSQARAQLRAPDPEMAPEEVQGDALLGS